MDDPLVPTVPRLQDLPPLPKLTDLPKIPSMKDIAAQYQAPKAHAATESLPDTPPPLPATPEDEKKAVDNLGWIKNLPESTVKLVKGIVYDTPKAALESAIHYARNPEQYSRDLALLFQKNNGLGRFFKEEMIDNYYNKDLWRNFNEDPARLLGDLAAVVSLGAGATGEVGNILGKAGRVGEVLARTAPEVAAAARARPVIAAGNALRTAGEAIDPFIWTAKGAAKIAAPALEALGFGKYTPDAIRIMANRKTQRSLEAAEEIEKVIGAPLSDVDNALLERHTRWGYTHELDALAAGPETPVSKAHRMWREIVTGGDEPMFKHLGTLDDEMATAAKAEKAAEYSRDHFRELGLERPVTSAEAKQMILEGKINPTFASTYRRRDQIADLFEIVNKPTYRGGAWSRFERTFNSNAPKVIDMQAVMARQIAAKYDALYKLDIVNELKALMSEKGEMIWVAPGTGEKFAIPNTHAPIQEAFYKKYWLDMIRAGEENVKLLSSAKDPVQGVAMARDLIESHPEIMHAIPQNGELYVPKHIAAMINREVAPISKMGRMYDNTMGAFKGLVTVFNPRFWGSVIFGNSVLGLLYGVSPDIAKLAYKYRGDMPAELRSLTRAEIFMRDKGIYSRVANKFGEAAQMLDSIYRLPIFASEVAKEYHARGMGTARDFFMSSNDVAAAIKYFGRQPGRLGNTRLRIEDLKSRISAASAEIQALERSKDRLGQALSLRAAREGPTRSAPGYDELGRKIEVEAELYPTGSGKPAKVPKTRIEPTPAPHDPIYGDVGSTSSGAPKKVAPYSPADVEHDYITGERTVPKPEKAVHGPKLGPQDTSRDFITGQPHPVERAAYDVAEGGHAPTLRQQRIAELQDKYGNAHERLLELKEERIHNLARMGKLQQHLPMLIRDAEVADRAIETGNRFFGSYARLSPFERQVVRRILPFYTFNKAMTMLAFRFPFLYPKRAFVGSHLAQAWFDITSDENSYMPARLRNYVPVMALQNGDVVAVSAGYLNPMGGVRMGQVAELPVPSTFNPLTANPIVQLGFKMAGAIPEWNAKPLSPGTYATRLDNGTVVQWTGKGFKTVVAQPSFLKSLADLFPQAQLIDKLVHPYAQTDRGWLFNPDPIVGPDGKPRYPKELVDIMLSNVIPTQTYNVDEVKRQERAKMAAVVKSYAKDMAFADEVKRNQIREVISAWRDEKNRRWVQ